MCACAVPAVEQPETAAEAFAQEPKQLRATIQAQMTAPKAHPEKAPAISGEAATADPGGGSSGATNADATPASEPAAATSGENPTSGGAANADWIDKFTKTCDATTKAAADKAAAAKSAAAKADKDAAEKAAADKAAKRLPKRAQVCERVSGRQRGVVCLHEALVM